MTLKIEKSRFLRQVLCEDGGITNKFDLFLSMEFGHILNSHLTRERAQFEKATSY